MIRRDILVRFLALVVFVGVALTAASPASAQAPDASTWNDPAEPFKIVGPIHYVGTSELASYLIATPAGHILIDGGLEKSGPVIEKSIRALGFKPEDIKILLTTQAHYDHVASMAYFQRLSHARVEAMKGDDVLLQSGGQKDFLASRWGKEAAYPAVKVDRVLRDGDTVALGGVTLTARATPGHTPGCTTWLTTIEDGGKAYAVVFPGSTTVNPGTRLIGQESYPGIARDYRRSFEVLESLKPDFFLAAHASAMGLAAKREQMKKGAATNPFIDPDGYRAHVAAKKKDFEKYLAEEQAAGASSGAPTNPKK